LASEVTNLSSYQLSNGVGLNKVIPTSVALGSGSGSVDATGTVTFTGASSVSLNNCFSSTYDNYKIMYDFIGSTGTNNNMRLRTSSDDTTSNYMRQYLYAASTTVAAARSNSQTTWLLGDHNSTRRTNAVVDLFSPNLAQVTGGQHYSAMFYDSSTENAWLQNGLGHNSTTQFTGFTIYPSSGTITGNIRVYGYKN
jgi:hypothetical protein